jgi:hypothetical protein
MTQFEPEIFELEGGRAPGSVFNAAYLGMTFPSLEALLVSVQKETLPKLDTVLFFVNPRRLSSLETPSEDVFRIGIPEPDGALSLALGRKQVAPLLDASRLYGLSRHLLLQSWRDALSGRVTFDHVELLGDHGGAVWAPSRSDPATPVYPYRQVEAISEERVDEVRRVLALLDAWGVETLLLTSPVHPDVEVFASPAAAAAYEATMERIAREHSAHFWPGLGSAFAPSDELSFTDYGHMNDTGAREYTTMLARSARLPLSRSWEK